MFVDENSDFDLDVADSLSYSSEQVCKTSQKDNAEITVFRLFNAENTLTPQISFLHLLLTAER